MKISVVIPAYNAERTIRRAIESVLAQTRPADEIIVIDDGSLDATAQVVRQFADKVTLIEQPNAGVSVARNVGIEAAAGDWIAFLDGDDEWLPEKLKLQSEQMQRNPHLMWGYSNFYLKKQGLEKRTVSQHPENFMDALVNGEFAQDYFQIDPKGANAWTCTLLIRKAVFETAGLFEPGMKRGQDNDMWYRIAYQFPQVAYLTQPLAIYHMDTSGSSVKINDSNDFMIQLIARHEDLSGKYGRHEAFVPCIRHMLQDRIRQLLRQKRHKEIGALLDRFEDYFPSRFKREMRLRLICPALFDPIADVIHKIKRVLK